ncbi:mitochondrial ribosomal subunit S27-domain-containing protein [Plectosphaerella cucumerina]|uniref:Small ribosomal subunit protein mS33 n=1 Tax=Plectosphaerella cucumerina TaxID=40658 RepID=A0A8K0WYK2_9PEZI|nr:mitochondrial ribosomal subunit S27-domain-containing protein [Plectosphaerella cucumerina]
MSVPRARLLDLMKTQCQIFSTTYNPERLRTGNKVLRQRLRGPSLATYYPERTVTVRDVMKSFGPHLTTFDLEEDDRLDHISELKSRGKSAPSKKKVKTAEKKKKN